MLILLEIAKLNKNIKYIELPEEVKQQNKEDIGEEKRDVITIANYQYIEKQIYDKDFSQEILSKKCIDLIVK